MKRIAILTLVLAILAFGLGTAWAVQVGNGDETVKRDLDVTRNATVGGTLETTGEYTPTGGIGLADDKALTFGTGDDWTCDYDSVTSIAMCVGAAGTDIFAIYVGNFAVGNNAAVHIANNGEDALFSGDVEIQGAFYNDGGQYFTGGADIDDLVVTTGLDISDWATVSELLGTNGSGSVVTITGVSTTEAGYLDGVTSAIQGQIDDKAPVDSPAFTTEMDLSDWATASELLGTDASSKVVTITGVSTTEAGYLDGVTSAIQGQIDDKAPIDSPAFTTTVGLPGPTTTAAASVEFTTNSLAKKTAVAPVSYLSATAFETSAPFSHFLCVGLAAGVSHIGSAEGYVHVDDAADYLRVGFSVPPLATLGAAADLEIEFDIDEQAAEEVNIDVLIYEYGATAPIVTDTITIANGAGRGWFGLDTLATGIGALVAVGDFLLVEFTIVADTDDVHVYGARATYSTGIENDAT